MRHLQSACHLGHLDELMDILRDEGSPSKNYSYQPSPRSSVSFSSYPEDEVATEYGSILTSGLGYSLSRDTDQVCGVEIFLKNKIDL